MALAHSPKIVTKGLVCCLDATNEKSYPGTGQVWTDLTGNGLNGQVTVTGPDFLQSPPDHTPSKNIKYFDYSYEYTTDIVTISNNDLLNYSYDNWCYSMWINRETADQSGWQQLFIKGSGNQRRPGVWFYSNNTTILHITWRSGGGTTQQGVNSSFNVPIGEWCNIVIQARAGTMMSFLNGVKDSNTVSISDYAVNSNNLTIGQSSGYVSPNMALGYFSVYNTSLTDQEILQNYLALKERFTYDPSNIPSFYSVTPTSYSVNEGSSRTFDVLTTNVPNATTLYFYNSKQNADFPSSSRSGSFSISNGSGSFSVTPSSDNSTEGSETFTMSVRTGSTSGPTVATSRSVVINDTSTGKIICTALNDMYGFGSFRNKLWMKYNNYEKALYPSNSEILQLGYHKVFGRLTEMMPTSP